MRAGVGARGSLADCAGSETRRLRARACVSKLNLKTKGAKVNALARRRAPHIADLTGP